jgi:hypothetical protein
MSERREFFVPARDRDYAERIWQATKTFAEEEHGWKGVTDHRIFRLDYMHDGKHMEAEIGIVHPYGGPVSWDEPAGPSGETVLVILENDGGSFLVCTENRGVLRGEPIIVGSGEPYQVAYFDGYGPDE